MFWECRCSQCPGTPWNVLISDASTGRMWRRGSPLGRWCQPSCLSLFFSVFDKLPGVETIWHPLCPRSVYPLHEVSFILRALIPCSRLNFHTSDFTLGFWNGTSLFQGGPWKAQTLGWEGIKDAGGTICQDNQTILKRVCLAVDGEEWWAPEF